MASRSRPGQAAVGREALGQDEHVAAAAPASASSFIASQPPMLARPSFLADIVMPSASAAISRTMSGMRSVRVARLALLDEPGVLGEAARVEEERQAVSVADRAHGAQVARGHRLAAARVVGDGDEHDRDVLGAALADEGVQRGDVHVALEGVDGRRVAALGDDRSTASAPVNSTLARVVSKCVLLGTTLPGPPMTLNRIFSAARPWWVGMTCLNGKSSWTRLEEPEPRRRAGIALVAALDAGPLLGRHGARARVGQQVDEDVVGVEVEQVVAGRLEAPLALLHRRQPDGLDGLDAERLDDRLPALHARSIRPVLRCPMRSAALFG